MTAIDRAGLEVGFSADDLAELSRHRHVAGDTSRDVLDLVVAWALHVDKIDLDRAGSLSDPSTWGAHDLVAALFIRDLVERTLAEVAEPLRSRVAQTLDPPDQHFRDITRPDTGQLIGPVAEVDPADRGWWWQRVPASGPILDELVQLQ